MTSTDAPIWLATLDQLPEPSARGFDPYSTGQDTLMLVRYQGQVYAYRDACPHFGDTPMAWRKDAYLNGDGTRIVCHAHGAQFDIATGQCLQGPCLGQHLTRLETVIDAHGRVGVYVNGPPAG